VMPDEPGSASDERFQPALLPPCHATGQWLGRWARGG
jgi:hypothetical protein